MIGFQTKRAKKTAGRLTFGNIKINNNANRILNPKVGRSAMKVPMERPKAMVWGVKSPSRRSAHFCFIESVNLIQKSCLVYCSRVSFDINAVH